MKELLNKYFEAEATLAEEALLRDYFAGKDIDPEFESYAPLFCLFAEERIEFVNDIKAEIETEVKIDIGVVGAGVDSGTEVGDDIAKTKKQKGLGERVRLRRVYYRVTAIGIAAALLVGVFLINFGKREAPLLIINGVRIDNPELAIVMAGESLNSMNITMEKIQSNRAHLEKIEKLGEIMGSLEGLSRSLSQNGEEDRLN